jgi:flagellar FliL protein
MAEADTKLIANEGEEQTPPPKKSKLKLIIILVLGLAILGGGGFFAWKFFFAGPGETAAETSEQGESPAPASAEHGSGQTGTEALDKDGKPLPPPLAPAPKLVLTLDPFMVNLADTNARHFLRVIVAIDVETEAMQTAVNERMPRIRDALILLFSSKLSGDLTSIQGKYRLRMEILRAVNNVLGLPDKLTQMFYMEFVVQ